MEPKEDPEPQSLDLCLENQFLFSVQNLAGNLISKDFNIYLFIYLARCPYLNFQ